VHEKEIKPDTSEQWLPLTKNLIRAATDTTDDFLISMINKSEKIVCCWGSWKFANFSGRMATVLWMIKKYKKEAYCFGSNADGQPKHPLYLKSSAQLEIYNHGNQ